MSFSKDRLIVAQNAATATATIMAALLNSGADVDPVGDFESIRTAIFEGSLALADGVIAGQDEAPARSTGGGFRKSGSYQNGGGQTQANDSGAGVVIKFGQKHRGETIADVYASDPQYIEWLAETSNNDFMRNKAQEFLASVA